MTAVRHGFRQNLSGAIFQPLQIIQRQEFLILFKKDIKFYKLVNWDLWNRFTGKLLMQYYLILRVDRCFRTTYE